MHRVSLETSQLASSWCDGSLKTEEPLIRYCDEFGDANEIFDHVNRADVDYELGDGFWFGATTECNDTSLLRNFET